MRFDIITVLPELLESPLNHSIMKRAKQKGHLDVQLHNLREFGEGKHRQVDDYQFGGGAGMVIKAEPIAACIESLLAQRLVSSSTAWRGYSQQFPSLLGQEEIFDEY